MSVDEFVVALLETYSGRVQSPVVSSDGSHLSPQQSDHLVHFVEKCLKVIRTSLLGDAAESSRIEFVMERNDHCPLLAGVRVDVSQLHVVARLVNPLEVPIIERLDDVPS